jgi:toxin YoeB
VKRKFNLIWSPESLKQIKWIQNKKSELEQKLYFHKIEQLLNIISETPFYGIGKPEHLKHEIPTCWSRRINKKDRLIYRVREKTIEIISIIGHYE